MAHVQFVDELVREYLLFRGFVLTAKSLDAELKADKDRRFRVDRIVDHLVACVNAHDLAGLRETWAHFDSCFFAKLERHFAPAVKKMESGLLKYYLVTAVNAGKTDKVTEFLSKMTPEIQSNPEWRDWYMLPYASRPEESPLYGVYFSRQWQDALLASLHNFLATIFQCLPQPTLSSYETQATMLKKLQEENAALKSKLSDLESATNPGGHQSRLAQHAERLRAPAPLTDDFYIIRTESVESCTKEARGLRSLIRQMGGSPVLGKKQTRSLSQT